MSAHFLTDLMDKTTKESKVEQSLKVPRKYKVILLNDDYTPMEFVVMVLRQIFHMTDTLATEVMLQVHFQGKGLCGVFTRDIAETKVALVTDCAKQHEHPLLCRMEPES